MLLQRLIYISVGTISVTNEKFKELIEDLIQNNHFTEDEGKRIIDAFLFDSRQQLDTWQQSIQLKLDDLMKQLGVDKYIAIKKEMEDHLREVKQDPTYLLRLPGKK